MNPQIPLLQFVGEVSLIYTRNHVTLPQTPITRSESAYNAFKEIFDPLTINHREFMYAIYLNRSNRLLGYAQISAGGLTGTVSDPKIIFQYALKLNASGIILVHNHPSGNLQPSQADIRITKKIREAGKLLDIVLLDHLIITGEGYHSMFDDGKSP